MAVVAFTATKDIPEDRPESGPATRVANKKVLLGALVVMGSAPPQPPKDSSPNPTDQTLAGPKIHPIAILAAAVTPPTPPGNSATNPARQACGALKILPVAMAAVVSSDTNDTPEVRRRFKILPVVTVGRCPRRSAHQDPQAIADVLHILKAHAGQ